MREHIELCQNGSVVIAASVIARAEILESSLTQSQKEKLDGLFKRRTFRLIQVNRAVAAYAHDIREHFRPKARDELPTVSTPDALHLATAIYMGGCREFYTFDAKDEYPKEGKTNGRRGLLPLNGFMQRHYGVTVEKPLTNNLSLLDSLGHE